MNDQEPPLWQEVGRFFESFAPFLWAVTTAVVLAYLRQVYEGGETWKRMTLEAVMCGVIAVALVSACDAFGVPTSASSFVGAVVGFLGVEKMRKMVEKWLGHRISR